MLKHDVNMVVLGVWLGMKRNEIYLGTGPCQQKQQQQQPQQPQQHINERNEPIGIRVSEITVCAEADNSPIRRRQADAADEDTNVANYMTGFEHAINEDGDDAMQKMYSLDHASNRQLVKAKIAQAIIEFQEKPGDTGSTQVQVAVLHTKIVSLSEHCNANRQDKHSRRGLEIMMEKRRKLLQYLKRKNFAKYNDVIKRLKLRPVAGIR